MAEYERQLRDLAAMIVNPGGVGREPVRPPYLVAKLLLRHIVGTAGAWQVVRVIVADRNCDCIRPSPRLAQ